MTEEVKTNGYSPQEERINVISHGLGFFMSTIATILLVSRALELGGSKTIISFSIFGVSLMILYAASTLYHKARKPALRNRLNIFDHASIYVLIAGTYTPFTLVTLNGRVGWMIFGISWGVALTGIVLKLFFTGRYKLLSTISYVLMGCIILLAINPLLDNLSLKGIIWLLGGGVAYILGAIFYSIKKITFNHAIFHIFVLMGSCCHFISIFFYVIPQQ